MIGENPHNELLGCGMWFACYTEILWAYSIHFKILIMIYLVVCVPICTHECAHDLAKVWGTEDNLRDWVLGLGSSG